MSLVDELIETWKHSIEFVKVPNTLNKYMMIFDLPELIELGPECGIHLEDGNFSNNEMRVVITTKPRIKS